MLRNIIAVIVGLVAGMVWNQLFVTLNATVLFPMPEGTTMDDAEKFRAYVETLPATAFLVVLVAHVGQAAVGGWVAARLGASRPAVLAWIVGILTAIGSVAAQLMFGGPVWMWIDPPLCLVAAWFVGRIECARRAKAAA
ncbi:MAG: hypothetical protein R3F20_02345 [Planctomycetota bacterium]